MAGPCLVAGKCGVHKIMTNKIFIALPPVLAAAMSCSGPDSQTGKPNILLIVADDLGMGDVSAYGSRTISTPHIDSLASEGIRFNRAYSTSATSTPSRYAIFTGMYPWKNPQAHILPGDAPLIIPEDAPTLPKMMQAAGYATGAIGKWHLGMGNGDVDWNRHIEPDANSVGFDYTCLVAATNDRVPTVYVENGNVVGLDPEDPIYVSYEKNFDGEPTALTNPEMLKMMWDHGHNCSIVNGIPRIGYMKGGQKARWVDEEMAGYFADHVKKFIDDNQDRPFFLYYGLHQPHVPRASAARFAGVSGMGPRGDAVIEADWCVGEVISYLEQKGLIENTLVIFTSDNGPVINDGYKDQSVELLGEHDPNNGMRGGKYSLYDGGTHIPMIIYWKGHLKPIVSDVLVSQLDLFASLGKFIGAEVADGLDSEEHINAFLGLSDEGRDHLVLEAQGRLAFLKGDYAMIPPYRGPKRNITMNELGNLDSLSLFNLKADKFQEQDLSLKEPERLSSMDREFRAIAGKYYNAGEEITEELK